MNDYAYKYLKVFGWKDIICVVKIPRNNLSIGRFGGGWNIKFGFASGKNSLIIFLFIMYISFTRRNKNDIPF